MVVFAFVTGLTGLALLTNSLSWRAPLPSYARYVGGTTSSTGVSLSWQQCVRIAGIARAMTVTDAVGGIAYARGRAGIAKQASGGTQRPASDRNAVVQQKHA